MLGDGLRELFLRHRAGKAVFHLLTNLDRHHAPVAASAMAFDAFLSLIPLTAFAGWIFGYLHETGDLVLRPLGNAAPIPVRALFDEAFFRLTAKDMTALAPISVAAFLWVSSAGLSTAMYVFEAMFRSPPRPWWWRRIIAMGCVLGSVSALAAVIAAAFLIVNVFGSWGSRAVAFAVPSAVIVGLLSGFFRIAIRGRRPRGRTVLTGALVTVVLWAVVSAAFSYYVSTLSRYTTLYGGLAAVAIFLFWLWLLALALLVGGEVNAELEGIRGDHPAAPVFANVDEAPPTTLPSPPEEALTPATRTRSGTSP